MQFQADMQAEEIERKRTLHEIESTKMKSLIEAIGKETIVAMARAGPETQAKLL